MFTMKKVKYESGTAANCAANKERLHVHDFAKTTVWKIVCCVEWVSTGYLQRTRDTFLLILFRFYLSKGCSDFNSRN